MRHGTETGSRDATIEGARGLVLHYPRWAEWNQRSNLVDRGALSAACQGVLDATAGDLVLLGTADEIALRLGVGPDALQAALVQLHGAQAILVGTDAAGRFAIRRERRRSQIPVEVDRRRPPAG